MIETRLYIANKEVELGDAMIAQTYVANDLSTLESVNCSYTNSFTLPRTPKNVLAFDGLGLRGSTSIKGYRRLNCALDVNNVRLINNGTAIVTETDSEGYKVTAYGEAKSLFDALGEKLLTGLNLADISHEYNFDNITDSWGLDLDYVHALAMYDVKVWPFGTAFSRSTWALDRLPACMFVHALWRRIFEAAGYTYEGDTVGSVFEDPLFLSLVLSPVKFPDALTVGFDEATALPKIKQSDFIKEIMWRFGLMVVPDVDTPNHFKFLRLESVLTDKTEALDWSSKLARVKTEKYLFGSYAQVNWFRYPRTLNDTLAKASIYYTPYSSSPNPIDEAQDQDGLDGRLFANNTTLEKEKDIVTSKFVAQAEATQLLGESANKRLYSVPIWVQETNGGEYTQGTTEPFIFSTKQLNAHVYIGTTGFTGNVAYLDFEPCHFSEFMGNYEAFEKMINRMQVVTADVQIDEEDLKALKQRPRIAYLKHLGAYYYVNKVNSYKGDPLTECELIKVY